MSYAPTVEQAAAVASRSREILLRAGAGTGKTTVLVDRYCDLIERGEAECDAILAFTFTRKAADQLRDRIRRELEARAQRAEDPETANRLAAAANRIGSAWVMTIHGFCQAVISAHPVAAGVDPGFTVIEGVAREQLRIRAFDRALERFLDEGDADEAEARELLVAAYRIAALRELVLDAYDTLRSHGEAEPRLPEPRPTDPAEALARLGRAAAELLADPDYRPHRSNHDKIEALARLGANAAEWLAGDPPHSGPAALLAELEANLFNSSSGGKGEVAGLAAEARCALHELLSGQDSMRRLARLFDLYAEEFAAAKGARSALDFDDLQVLAVRLLESPAVGDGYRRRFTHLMVDEFQDTSPVQIRLIDALRRPETRVFQVGDKFQAIYAFRHADLANFDRVHRRLLGDPEAEVLPLTGNFRSRAAILSVANELASALLPGFPPLRVGAAEQGREPRGGGSGVELILTASDGWDEADPAPVAPEGTTPKRAAEAEAVAARLAELHAAGVPRGDMVVLLRTLGPAEVYAAALERAGLRPFVAGGHGFWEGRAVADALALLKAVANPLDEEGLFGALASGACAASPDALWILRRAAGRAPIWWAVERLAGIESGELERPDWLERLTPEDAEAIVSLHAVLAELRELRRTLGSADLIERSITASGLDLVAVGGPRGAAGLASLRKLVRLAGEYEAAEGRDLRAFLEYAAVQAERGSEAEAPIAAEGHDGVRILTMHAAKGLEFPVVCVPELGRRFGGGWNSPRLRLARNEGEDWLVGLELPRLGEATLTLFDCEEIKELEAADQESEELRLFYVAMTRARERLILSGQAIAPPKEGIGRRTPVISRLLDLLSIDAGGAVPPRPAPIEFAPPRPREDVEAEFEPAELELRFNWPEPESRMRPGARPAEAAAAQAEGEEAAAQAPTAEPGSDDRQTDVDATPPAPDEAARPPIEPLPPPAPSLPALSFTALAAFDEAGAEAATTPDEAEEEPRRRESDEIGLDASGRAFGTAVHELLERALIPGPAGNRWRPVSEARIRNALAAQGLDPERDPGPVERARGMIEGWMESPLCLEVSRRGTGLRAEVPLLLQLGDDGEVRLRGWIDLLAEPHDGPPLVIDYKTSRLDGLTPAQLADGYRLQGEIYALAVSRALGAPEVEVSFVALERPDQPAWTRFGQAELERAEQRVLAAVERLRARSADSAMPPETPESSFGGGALDAGREFVQAQLFETLADGVELGGAEGD